MPFVERGKRVVLGGHPKGGFIVYANKNNVIIRDLSVIFLFFLMGLLRKNWITIATLGIPPKCVVPSILPAGFIAHLEVK